MFKNRVRLPFYLSKPQFPVERSVFRKADGSSKLLSAVIRNTYEGKTDQIPEVWHRKLVIALAHDEVTIEDNRYLTDVVIDGEYEIDWQDFLDYPIAQAGFKVQTTPFNATNSNCQSCEEMTQLSLVDDYTDEIWNEGTTNDYPDLITANDNICCSPFLIEIVSYNALYFTSVTVDQDGVLTATVRNPVPNISDVLIATYRVTCENGGYDEANVYGNISGASTACAPTAKILVTDHEEDPTQVTLTWLHTVPPPADGYNWALYDSFGGTPVQSGNTANDFLVLTGLTPGADYYFSLTAVCSEFNQAPPSGVQFTTLNSGTGTCGRFTITYLPPEEEDPQGVSYMDCAGVIHSPMFAAAGSVSACMMIDIGSEDPIFFTATSPYITYTYVELC